MLTIAKKYTFHASHWLPEHDHCGDIHGHTYHLEVMIIGTRNKIGMLVDFHDLDKVIEPIIDEVDHTNVNVWMNGGYTKYSVNEFGDPTFSFVVGEDPEPPTVENMIVHFAEIIEDTLPEHLKLFRLRLWETEDAYAMVIPNSRLNEIHRVLS